MHVGRKSRLVRLVTLYSYKLPFKVNTRVMVLPAQGHCAAISMPLRLTLLQVHGVYSIDANKTVPPI